MNYVTSKSAVTGKEIKLYYQDIGEGQPVIFLHGWPMSHEMWEYQVGDIALSGFRCIAYDRRGFGKSSKPIEGYDYDTLADDLAAVIGELELEDVVLVGFSMGGGEVARYFSRYGGKKIAKVVLIGAVTPFLLKTDDNEDGVDVSVFEEMIDGIKNDRIGFLDGFGRHFFGVNVISHPISTPLLEYYRMLCSFASPIATMDCVKAFAQTDFRKDLPAINVPTLIVHGDADKIVPIEISGDKTAKMINGSQYVIYEGAPHGLFYTHRQRLNKDLVDFINDNVLGEEVLPPDSVILPTNYPI